MPASKAQRKNRIILTVDATATDTDGELAILANTIQGFVARLNGADRIVVVKDLLAALDCNIVMAGAQTVDGRDVSVDGTKLDGISVSANRYVTRTVNTPDFTEAAFVRDGTWKVDGLDLSSIVPSGATAVHLVMLMRSSVAGGQFFIRENATSNENQILAYAQAVNIPMTQNALVKIDADRLMDYFGSADVNFIFLSVVGWVL